ncbi:MAG TPA: copper transporter [Firmicutes bacterium]|nr:copper transporter [Bacillota bacterium]
MIIDLRYHIASLVAVFLALGIGILIGSALLGNDALVLEQEKMLSRLEQEFNRVKDELRAHQETIKKQEMALEVDHQFHKVILPYLLKGQLQDRRIVLVRTTEVIDMNLAKELAALLRSAGAEVTSITSFSQWPRLNDPTERQATALALGKDPNQSRWTGELFNELMEELSSGRSMSCLSMLQSRDFIQLSGDYTAGPCDTLIILGGERENTGSRVREIDFPLIDAARRQGLTVIGAEPLSAAVSYVPEYRKKGISTVDNIDTIPGQSALVFALASGKRGHYGVKDTARTLMPELGQDQKNLK